MADRRMLVGVSACAGVIGALLLLAHFSPPPALSGPASLPDAPAQPSAPAAAAAEANSGGLKLPDLFIGHQGARKIQSVMTTRKGDALFQAMIRYEPQACSALEIPGAQDVLQLCAQRGQPLPSRLVRIDDETEMISNNLGEPVRSVTVYRAYCNPIDGRVVAYDLIQTNGGQPQHMAGHITRRGMLVEFYSGGVFLDSREVPLSPDTFIPPEMEFIHRWYLSRKDVLARREAVKFHVFVPGFTTSVLLAARPLDDEVLSVKDATYQCARYEVQAVSEQSAAGGARIKQEFWFDKRSGRLMKRQETDAVLKGGENPVTERVPNDRIESNLSQMQPLLIRPPVLRDAPVPFPLNQEQIYTIQTTAKGETSAAANSELKPIGSIRLKFSPSVRPDLGAYAATATVNMSMLTATGVSSRHETAETFFDARWRPVRYAASGEESADMKAAYTVDARIEKETLQFAIKRDLQPLEPHAGLSAAGAGPAAFSASQEWQPPLRRIPLTDDAAAAEDSAAAAMPLTHYEHTRALLSGTFLFDFNRIEHLAAFAHRLPLPAPSADGKYETLYQPVALFSVRQNRCGVLVFEIKAEPRPVLTERQKKRWGARLASEPQLFTATCNTSPLPCTLLLAPDGRILEMTLRLGGSEIVYTLDDPIMQARAERAKKQRLSEGPQLIRPPWW